MRLGLAIGLAVFGLCFVGCESGDSSDTPAGDCRNAGQECGAGFACSQNPAGDYECLLDGTGGGSGGDSLNDDAGPGAGGGARASGGAQIIFSLRQSAVGRGPVCLT